MNGQVHLGRARVTGPRRTSGGNPGAVASLANQRLTPSVLEPANQINQGHGTYMAHGDLNARVQGQVYAQSTDVTKRQQHQQHVAATLRHLHSDSYSMNVPNSHSITQNHSHSHNHTVGNHQQLQNQQQYHSANHITLSSTKTSSRSLLASGSLAAPQQHSVRHQAATPTAIQTTDTSATAWISQNHIDNNTIYGAHQSSYGGSCHLDTPTTATNVSTSSEQIRSQHNNYYNNHDNVMSQQQHAGANLRSAVVGCVPHRNTSFEIHVAGTHQEGVNSTYLARNNAVTQSRNNFVNSNDYHTTISSSSADYTSTHIEHSGNRDSWGATNGNNNGSNYQNNNRTITQNYNDRHYNNRLQSGFVDYNPTQTPLLTTSTNNNINNYSTPDQSGQSVENSMQYYRSQEAATNNDNCSGLSLTNGHTDNVLRHEYHQSYNQASSYHSSSSQMSLSDQIVGITSSVPITNSSMTRGTIYGNNTLPTQSFNMSEDRCNAYSVNHDNQQLLIDNNANIHADVTRTEIARLSSQHSDKGQPRYQNYVADSSTANSETNELHSMLDGDSKDDVKDIIECYGIQDWSGQNAGNNKTGKLDSCQTEMQLEMEATNVGDKTPSLSPLLSPLPDCTLESNPLDDLNKVQLIKNDEHDMFVDEKTTIIDDSPVEECFDSRYLSAVESSGLMKENVEELVKKISAAFTDNFDGISKKTKQSRHQPLPDFLCQVSRIDAAPPDDESFALSVYHHGNHNRRESSPGGRPSCLSHRSIATDSAGSSASSTISTSDNSSPSSDNGSPLGTYTSSSPPISLSPVVLESIKKPDSSSYDLENNHLVVNKAEIVKLECMKTSKKGNDNGIASSEPVVANDDDGSKHNSINKASNNLDDEKHYLDNLSVSIEEQRIYLWQHYSNLVTPTIQQVVEFAKQVPGFLSLQQLDQLMLIKHGFFEIWIVIVSRMLCNQRHTIVFSDGTIMTAPQLAIMFDKNFVSLAFNFCFSFNQLSLNDTELSLVSAMILLHPRRHGLNDPKDVAKHQGLIAQALKIQLQLGRRHNDAKLYSDLISNLGKLKAITALHNKHIEWLRLNWSLIKLPTLYCEIFDIPLGGESSIGDDSERSASSSPQASSLDFDESSIVGSPKASEPSLKQTSTIGAINVKPVGGLSPNNIELELIDPEDRDENFFALGSFATDNGESIDEADLEPSVSCFATEEIIETGIGQDPHLNGERATDPRNELEKEQLRTTTNEIQKGAIFA
ncbi:Ecdysone-induced protein 78C [Fragariocoptes setiger]|uniref:Ecdysone-induced protein 78C n=1 Tax=Fragariocoptes setiger TaxID=1670756 RepID=A0ABQ7SAE6_9ACAR|nr:Ecdysone-induced protein 78C [Fragariocoptes setiger]